MIIYKVAFQNIKGFDMNTEQYLKERIDDQIEWSQNLHSASNGSNEWLPGSVQTSVPD